MDNRGNGEAARMDLVVLSGDPVTGILGQIENPQDALLVVGNHRGGPAGVVASTGVGRALLYRAPCAVVTIPL
jgi:nucleotide-binding universal stress UspA family protein